MNHKARITYKDASDFLLLFFICGAVTWYLMDTMRASQRIGNLIFVVPVSVVALLLGVVVFAQIIRRIVARQVEAPQVATDPLTFELWSRMRPAMVAALFVVYVFALERIGFDVATFAFVGIALAIQGERNVSLVIGYAAVTAAFLTYVFRLLLPYPLTTLLM